MTEVRTTGPQRGAAGASPTDTETVLLVQAAQLGDREAIACLVSAHRQTLDRFCRRLMGDATAGEDLAQEALLRAQLSIGRLGPPYRFGPWLLGIAANLAKKAWRAEARRPLSWETLIAAYPNVAWDESLTAAPSPERHSEAAEELQLLADAIAALPRSLSDPLVLHYLEGLSYAEVADALALPVSTIKGRLFESRSRLRESLTACGVRDATDRTHPDSETTPRGRSARERNPMSQTRTAEPNRIGIGTHLRVEVDVEGIAREAEHFLSETWPRPRPRAALDELASPRNRFLSIEVLESMVLDGASQRDHVQPFIDYCLAEWGLTEHADPATAAMSERSRARAFLNERLR